MDQGDRQTLSDKERLDWLRLIRSENVGPVTFWHLLRHFGSAEAALEALPELSRRGGRSNSVRIASIAAAEVEVGTNRKAGARLVAAQEPDYPWRLAATEDAPPLISLAGAAALGNAPVVAIVGARNASSNGKRIARTIAQALARPASPSLPAWRAASMPQPTTARWKRAPSPSSPAESMSAIRPSTTN